MIGEAEGDLRDLIVTVDDPRFGRRLDALPGAFDGFVLDSRLALTAAQSRQALQRSARVAVTKFAWSGRERLGLLRVRDNVIVLHAMRWPDEVRDPSELYPPAADGSDAEVDEAVELIERMTTDRLEGLDFVDHYTEALE
ncbi:Ku protein [Streptomyces sp. NPDC054804]